MSNTDNLNTFRVGGYVRDSLLGHTPFLAIGMSILPSRK